VTAIIIVIIWFSLGYVSLALFFYTMKLRIEHDNKQKVPYMSVVKTFVSHYEMDQENKTARPEIICLLFVGTGLFSLLTNIGAYRGLMRDLKQEKDD